MLCSDPSFTPVIGQEMPDANATGQTHPQETNQVVVKLVCNPLKMWFFWPGSVHTII